MPSKNLTLAFEQDVSGQPESVIQTSGHLAPSFTSRISVQKVCAITGQFDDFKRNIVSNMGFQGMSMLHILPKINLRLSAFLLERIDTERMVLDVDPDALFHLTPESVKDVFDLPLGSETILAESSLYSQSLDEYTRQAALAGHKGIHSLKFVEVYLLKPLSEHSSQLEIECFQIAFVIYVIGNLLAPTAKHDYVTLDFMNVLALSSAKLKADIASGNTSVHIGGCHLFLQVCSPRQYISLHFISQLRQIKFHLLQVYYLDHINMVH